MQKSNYITLEDGTIPPVDLTELETQLTSLVETLTLEQELKQQEIEQKQLEQEQNATLLDEQQNNVQTFNTDLLTVQEEQVATLATIQLELEQLNDATIAQDELLAEGFYFVGLSIIVSLAVKFLWQQATNW